ncbi:hypothetical protein OHV05_37945 (plasmid) [Kitasatospora sp. NBC_00070]|uniref:hypothetical protein n=1 Tax=Kitasatospora sp. NBC_00070 TaxID=2975962 RepID=UPI002F90681C
MTQEAVAPRPRPKPARPKVEEPNPRAAFSRRRATVTSLDEVARAHPARRITVDAERANLTFYSSAEQPNAFSMDSLEFLFIVAQYYRGNLPLRLILVLIANQQAGGEVELTQEQMGDILDVHRSRISETLLELAGHGIAVKIARGRYRLNPVYSYRAAALRKNADGKSEYVQVDQSEVLRQLMGSDLPEKVRYPTLQALVDAITEDRSERAERRKSRAGRRNRPAVGQTELMLDVAGPAETADTAKAKRSRP